MHVYIQTGVIMLGSEAIVQFSNDSNNMMTFVNCYLHTSKVK